MTELVSHDITTEEWREYEFLEDKEIATYRVYRINNPVELYFRVGGTTHRVVDEFGVVHCLPAPGENGCVLRWLNRDPSKPVDF